MRLLVQLFATACALLAWCAVCAHAEFPKAYQRLRKQVHEQNSRRQLSLFGHTAKEKEKAKRHHERVEEHKLAEHNAKVLQELEQKVLNAIAPGSNNSLPAFDPHTDLRHSGKVPKGAAAAPPLELVSEEQIKNAEALLDRARLQKNMTVDVVPAASAAATPPPPPVTDQGVGPVPTGQMLQKPSSGLAKSLSAPASAVPKAPFKMHQPTPAPTAHPKMVPTSAPAVLPARKSSIKSKKKAHTKDASRLGDHCQWTSPGFNGKASYDLRPLRVQDETKLSYHITNNDGTTSLHPHELDYSFLWNLCGDVTPPTEPLHGSNVEGICRDDQRGAVIQYANRTESGFTLCHVIGRYDPDNEPSEWELLDPVDPTLGVSMTYAKGDGPCEDGSYRKSTIRIACANVKFLVEDAFEDALCSYVMHMHSWHACPLECPVTNAGLCSGNGRCVMHAVEDVPFCLCNDGWFGEACDTLPEWFSHLFIAFIAVLLIAYCWLRFDKNAGLKLRRDYSNANRAGDYQRQAELTSLIS